MTNFKEGFFDIKKLVIIKTDVKVRTACQLPIAKKNQMIINVCPFFNDVFKALIFLGGGGGYGPGMRIRRKNLRACQSTNASFVSLHQLKGHERAHCSI